MQQYMYILIYEWIYYGLYGLCRWYRKTKIKLSPEANTLIANIQFDSNKSHTRLWDQLLSVHFPIVLLFPQWKHRQENYPTQYKYSKYMYTYTRQKNTGSGRTKKRFSEIIVVPIRIGSMADTWPHETQVKNTRANAQKTLNPTKHY